MTFSRYGGLQIFLRAITQGGSLVLSNAQESIENFLARAAAEGATHISGTVALAAQPHEFGRQVCAPIHSFVRRDCGPGYPGQTANRLP